MHDRLRDVTNLACALVVSLTLVSAANSKNKYTYKFNRFGVLPTSSQIMCFYTFFKNLRDDIRVNEKDGA